MPFPTRPLVLVIGGLLCLSGLSAADAPAGQDRKLNRRDIEKLVAEADKLVADGQLADARQRLNTIVQQDPANAAVALKLARVCESLKAWDCAGGAYQMAASNATGADKAEAHAGLAAAHLRGGRFSDAAESARAAIGLNPSLAAAHITLATSLVRSGAPGATSAAQKAVEVAPASDAAQMALGQALAAEGKHAEAEAPFRKVLELQPKSAEAHASIADIQFRRKDFDGVIASVGTALELDRSLTRLYSIRGRAQYEKGKEDEAIGDLQTAVAVKSEDSDAHLLLGRIYRKRRQLDLAAKHYQSAAADVQLGEAYLGFVDALVAKRDFDTARGPVEKAAAGLPQSAQAQYLLGALRAHYGQYDEAVKAFQQAATLDPKLTPAHLGLGRVLREHKKDAAGAVASLEKALALEPEHPDVLSELGVALYEAKQPDRAIQMLQKAVAAPGYENAMGFAVLGLALKDRQNFGDALGYFEKAVALAPKWWLPHWGAAWSHFGQIKKGCPCGEADDQRIKKMKAHYDSMTSLEGKDAALEVRVDALLKGQKIK
jgi:tetratricopeptide (TPR) repeat protein